MYIALTNFSAIIKIGIWLPILVATIFIALNVFLIVITYHPKNKQRNFDVKNNIYNYGEIEKQLQRQTDLLERDRWDRISNGEKS
jgi:hypothetical protein